MPPTDKHERAWNGKWCTYCRADTHNDAECWCTRPADWHPGQYVAVDAGWLKKSAVGAKPQCCGDWDSLAGKCVDCPHETASADRAQEPAAWLEVGEKSGVVGVSLERDDSSPFGWEPLYRAPVAPNSSVDAQEPRGPTLMQRLSALYLVQTNAADGETLKEAIDTLKAYRVVHESVASATSPTNAVELLKRIRQWDMLDVTGDGPYWKGEIDKALGA